MAKLKAPLMSLGASGALGKSIVYFPWKGLDVVREYVIPANPKSDDQLIQRGYFSEGVTAIHAAQALADDGLEAIDILAYALYGSTFPTPRTWFNQIMMRWLLAATRTEHREIFGSAEFTDVGAGATTIIMINQQRPIETGFMCCGTSKTALHKKVAADGVANLHTGVFTGLTKGEKYYFQFRPDKVVDDQYVMRSGIYHHVQLA